MLLTIFGLYLVIHLTVGFVRGMYRFSVINKYHQDYYTLHPMGLAGRISHNFYQRIIKRSTFFYSLLLTLTVSMVYYKFFIA